MKKNIDIEELSRLTHTPKGRYGATDENYAILKSRLDDQPRKVEVKRQRTLWQKIAIAASVIIVSSISYAMIDAYILDMPRHKTLTYHEAPISQIISDIEEAYDVRITVDDASRLDYRLTAEFSTDEELEDIIASLSTASGLALRVEQPLLIDN